MTTPSITDLLKYADLQMAAEAFLVDAQGVKSGQSLEQALKEGNNHASKFTQTQAADFLAQWEIVAQQPNTDTGFSGTLFKNRATGEVVMSFRSTEFIDDAARDNQATNDLEIKSTGFAWGQIRDMENWYAQMVREGKVTPGAFSVTAGNWLGALVRRWRKRAAGFKQTFKLALLGAAVVALSACGTAASSRGIDKSRQETAIAMWKERCQKAGEFIHQTVEDVEGVYLMKVRDGINFGDQFKLDDPYGHDSSKEQLVMSFLRKDASPENPSVIATKGYRYVVAKDLGDGQLYRFTGRTEEPWQTDKSYLKGYTRFVMDKSPPPNPLPRYGVTWDDISTREEREYWIAGSSLKVIDLQTNQVIAERVGYMVDWAQGSKAGHRSPWLFAADTACPAFRDPSVPRRQPDASGMAGQTHRFVSKVLKPKQ